jgi:ribosomal protein S18 acetylase RimI-like enzyme
MVEIQIRRATAADAAALAQGNITMAAETEDRALDGDTVRRGVAAVLADAARGQYFVAQRDGQVVGQMLITYEASDWRDGTFWWIQSVHVSAAARGQGVYRALHRYVEAQAKAAGDVCGLRLYVEKSNTRAQAVYRAMGMGCTEYDLYEIDWSAGAQRDQEIERSRDQGGRRRDAET